MIRRVVGIFGLVVLLAVMATANEISSTGSRPISNVTALRIASLGVGVTPPTQGIEVTNTSNGLSTYTTKWNIFAGVVAGIRSGSDAETDFGNVSAHNFYIMTNGTRVAKFGTSGTLTIPQLSSCTSGVKTDVDGLFSCVTSDERLKNIEGPYVAGLSSLGGLRPIRYTWKEDRTALPVVGFSAQNVQAIIPDAVMMNPKTGNLQLDTTAVLATAVNAIQELQQRVEVLEAQCGR